MKKNYFLITTLAFAAIFSGYASANDVPRDCPAELTSSLDAVFGSGAAGMTRCIQTRNNVKVVYQINQFTDPSNSAKPYGLGNIQNAINDYTLNYGMTMGKDVDIAVVVHSGGGKLLIQDAVLQSKGQGSNPFEGTVKKLLSQGVNIYLCQNTARSLITKGVLTSGYATGELIEGVQFVTSGVTAIPDFQTRGYNYVQP